MDSEKFKHYAFEMYIAGLRALLSYREYDNPTERLSNVEGKSKEDYEYGIDKLVSQAYHPVIHQLAEKEKVIILSEHHSNMRHNDEAKYFVMLDPVDGSRELMRDARAAWMIFAYGEWKGENTKLKDIKGVALGKFPTSTEEHYVLYVAVGNEKPKKYEFKGQKGELENKELWKEALIKPPSLTDIEHKHICFFSALPPYKYAAEMADAFLEEAKAQEVFMDQYLSTAGLMVEMLEGKLALLVDLRKSIKEKHGKEMLCAHPYDVAGAYLLKQLGVIITGKDLKEESFWDQSVYPLDNDIDLVVFSNKMMYKKYGKALEIVINRSI